jgi:hypothetical protein
MAKITRLYDLFQPEHYDIFLDISRETKHFRGKTVIQGDSPADRNCTSPKGFRS